MTIILWLFFFLVLFTGIGFGGSPPKETVITGQIIDNDTRQPISGVVVSACWMTDISRLTIEPKQKPSHFYEVSTNADGNFVIPYKEIGRLGKRPPSAINIFKSGYPYLYLQDLGKHFKMDNPMNTNVRWEGPKVIIPYPRISLEERRQRFTRLPPKSFDFLEFAPVSPEDITLYLKEVARESDVLYPSVKPSVKKLQSVKAPALPASNTSNIPVKTK